MKKINKLILIILILAVMASFITACSSDKVKVVKFYVDGKETFSYRVEQGKTLDIIPEVPKKEGYIGKWDVEDSAFDEILTDMKVNAIYEKSTYTLTFVADGKIVQTFVIVKGRGFDNPPAVPEKEGYDGVWDVESFSGITTDVTITAIYIPKPIYVNFYSEDSIYTEANVTPGEKIVKNKYYDLDSGDYKLTNDETFKKGKNYYLRERTLIDSIRVVNGAPESVPEPPKKENLSAKWVAYDVNSKEITPSFTNVTKTFDVYLKSYVTVRLVDELCEKGSSFGCEIGEVIEKIDAISAGQPGREFYGWYEDAELKNEITFPYSFSTNVVLYAKWVTVESTEGLTFEGNKVVSYDGAAEEVYVPYRYEKDGKYTIVEEIAASAFEGAEITKIHLPHTIKKIGEKAFCNAAALKKAVFDNGNYVEEIGESAFYNCALLTEYEFSEKTASIGKNAFYNCVSIVDLFGTEEAKFTTVTEGAFYNCASVKLISLPAKVSEIENNAFSGCHDAEFRFADSNSITKIGDYAFADCYMFAGITSENLTDIGIMPFSGCYRATSVTTTNDKKVAALFGTEEITTFANEFYTVKADGKTYFVPKVLYNVTLTAEDENAAAEGILSDVVSVKRVVFINGVKKIADDAFRCYENVADNGDELRVTLPSGLEEIGSYAFATRTDIFSITINDEVKKIGEYAFYNLRDLGKVVFGENSQLTESGARSFDGTSWRENSAGVIVAGKAVLGVSESYCRNKNYTEITAWEMGMATYIAPYAFENNKILRKIALGSEIKSIGDKAFGGMDSLTTFAFNKGSSDGSTRKLGEYVINDCNALVDLTIYEDINIEDLCEKLPDSLDVLRIECTGAETRVEANRYSSFGTPSELHIGDGFISIEENAFAGNENLRKVYVGKDLASVGARAFENDRNLTVFDTSANRELTEIKESAFKNSALTSFDCGTKLESIGAEAFSGTALKSFVMPGSLSVVSARAFMGCSLLTEVKFGSGLQTVEEFAFADADLRDFRIPLMQSIGDGVFVGNDNPGTITFSDYSFIGNVKRLFKRSSGTDGDIYELPQNFNGAVIESGKIADFAFEDIKTIQNLRIDNAEIGERAFASITNLSVVTISAGVTKIGVYAFSGCGNLSTVRIEAAGSKLTSIGNYAFENCASLSYMVVPQTITDVEWEGVFEGCSGIVSVNVPNSVTKIGKYAFKGCEKLVTVTMGRITEIAEEAFYGCKSLDLDNADFAELQKIGASAFFACANLHGIKAVAVTEIGQNAFEGCASIEEITVLNGETLDYYIGGEYTDKIVAVNVVGSVAGNFFNSCANLKRIVFYSDSVDDVKPVLDYYLGKNSPYVFARSDVYDSLKTEYAGRIHSVPTQADFNFEPVGGEARLTNMSQNDDEVVYLPEKTVIGGVTYKVTAIAEEAFLNNYTIKEIVVPSSIRTIGSGAFKNSSLEEIVFENGSALSVIESNAFYGCKNIKTITLPSSVTTIGSSAFYGCENLSEVVTYDNSKLSAIEEYAFYSTKNLEEFIVKDGLTALGAFAFSGSGITRFEFGKNVALREIASGAFSGCVNLASVIVPSGVRTVCENAFMGVAVKSITLPDSVVTVEKGSFANASKLENVTFGRNLTAIGNEAFKDCKVLSRLEIPDSLVSIGEKAFAGCTNKLQYVSIGENVTTIGKEAFANANSLTELRFNAKKATDFTADNCVFQRAGVSTTGLKVYVGSKVRRIPAYMFNAKSATSDAPKITEFNFGNDTSCTQIGAYAFAYCDKLRTMIIPVNVSGIGENAFLNCNAVSLTLEARIAPARYTENWNGNVPIDEASGRVKYAYNNVQSGDYYYVVRNGKAYLTGYAGTDKNVVVPDSIKGYEIADLCVAFEKHAEIETVTFPDNLTVSGSFYGCSSLKRVYFGDGLREIFAYAFYGCSSLNYVKITSNVTTVGVNAFGECAKLDTIYIDSAEVISEPDYTSCVGGALSEAMIVYVSEEVQNRGNVLDLLKYHKIVGQKRDKYDIYTKLYWDVSANADGAVNAYLLCENEDVYTYNLIVDGSGDMKNFASQGYIPWRGYSEHIIRLTVGENVTRIGKYAFNGLTALEHLYYNAVNAADCKEDDEVFSNGVVKPFTLTIGENVISIPAYLFRRVSNMKNIVWNGNKVERIGADAFEGCSMLSEIIVPDSVIYIEKNAFAGTKGVNELTIGEKTHVIGSRAFANMQNLQKIYYNARATLALETTDKPFDIEHIFVQGMSGVTLYVGSAVNSIPARLFTGYKRLTHIVFPSGSNLKNIGYGAFEECSGLTSVTFPLGLESVGEKAFDDCTGLTEILFTSGSQLKYIGQDAFLNTAYYNDRDNNWKNGVLYVGSYLIKAEGISGEYAINDSTTLIAQNAFHGLASLEYLLIPQNVTYVNADAFSGCSALTAIFIKSRYVAPALNAAEDLGGLASNALHLYVMTSLVEGLKIKPGEYFNNYSLVETAAEFDKVRYYAYTKAYWDLSDGRSSTVYGYAVNDSLAEDSYVLKIVGKGRMKNFESVNSVIWKEYVSLDSVSRVYIGKEVERIGAYAFAGCAKMQSFSYETDPAIKEIGAYAFSGCSSLTEITVPASIKTIGQSAFSDCTNVSRIYFNAEECNDVSARGSNVFANLGKENLGATLEIGYNVRRIPANMFCVVRTNTHASPNLTSIIFRAYSGTNKCAEIGDYAFAYCENLSSITYATTNVLTSIGAYAFTDCLSLGTVVIPPTVTYIGEKAYSGCANLTEVSFNAENFETGYAGFTSFDTAGEESPNGFNVTVSSKTVCLPDYLFEGAKFLSSVEFDVEEGNLKSIGTGAFEDCGSLRKIELPKKLEKISMGAFAGCTGLQEYVAPFIGGEHYKFSAAENTVFGYVFGTKVKDGATATLQNYGSGMDTYYVPDSLKIVDITVYTNVYFGAFMNCVNLNTVTLRPNTGVIRLERRELNKQTNTYEVVESIVNGSVVQAMAFSGCKGLATVNFTGSPLTTIGREAFENCSNIGAITIPENVTTIEDDAFAGCLLLRKITFKAENCQDFNVDTFAQAGINQGGNSDGLHLVIGKNVKRIPARMFASGAGNSSKLFAIDFEKGSVLAEIGENAFVGAEYLKDIVLPSTINDIGQNAFTDTAFYNTAANWRNNVLYVGEYLIKARESTLAAEYTVTPGTSVIADYAFAGNKKLEKLYLSAGLKNIGDYAFSNCQKLDSVVTSSATSLTSIGSYAFEKCMLLGAGVDEQENPIAFTIPASVKTIGENAFIDCVSLSEVYVDSYEVVNAANASTDCGNLFCYAETIRVRSDIQSVGAYIAGNFAESGGVSDGYAIYLLIKEQQ